MTFANDNRQPPRALRCDVRGCNDEIALRVGDEQRCFCHAMDRARELRRAATSQEGRA
jgi:hypothetical protein